MTEAVAQQLLQKMSQLEEMLKEAGKHGELQAMLSACRREVEGKCCVEALPRRGRRHKLWGVQQWRRRCYHLTESCKKAQKKSERVKSKVAGRITNYWLVRAGLCDPAASVRTSPPPSCSSNIQKHKKM